METVGDVTRDPGVRGNRTSSVPYIEDRLLSMREVAELTGLSVGTLYHMISQGRLPTVRISSRCVRTRLSALHEWWDQLSENPKGGGHEGKKR
jgi:excisionase family DNA binding protein